METFDDISCEEFYDEAQLAAWEEWMEELQIDFLNGELCIIADEENEAAIDLQYEEMVDDLICIRSTEDVGYEMSL